MKILIIAIFALVALAGCGGGGGGNAPSMIPKSPPTTLDPAPIITPEQQRELNSDLQDLREAATANGDADLLAEIARLQNAINARDRRIEELRAEIAELENRIPPPLPQPTTKECNGVQIPITDNCPPTTQSPFDSSYYLTETGARYAHDEGYTGEGVTVYIGEQLRHTHVAISANIISLSTENNRFQFGTDSSKSHGTGVAGILVNIAPSIRLVNPVGDSWDAASYGAQIVNRSLGFNEPDDLRRTDSLAEITMHLSVIARADYYAPAEKSDIVWVNAAGNDGETAPELTGAFPYIHPDLEDNWLIATALNPDTTAASFTNHCGYARMWCISAFGVSLQTADSKNDTDDRNFSGTSAATPVVAGALAVLKSAADDLHSGTEMTLMTNVRLILLETATDLGDPGVDEVYGWGLVNISAGITHLQGIAGQMAAIEEMNIARLGGAAAAANSGKFAAAAGESAFRFWGGLETESVYGGLATKEYGGISAFGEVGNAALEINSFLANGEVQNAESESWTAGIQRGNIWRHNDNLQISARQESRLNDGELVLQYSFGKQIRIPIKQKPATIWTAAYSQESDNGKWTAAMEWNAATNAKGFSFAAEIDL